MTSEFFQRVHPLLLARGESEAKFVLSVADAVNATGESPIVIRGALDGPYCSAARTLPAQFTLRAGVDSTSHAFAMAIVPDPCFWTPALPFLYRLDLDVVIDGRATAVDAMVGFRRWECDRESFRLERKRVVLRGGLTTNADNGVLLSARAGEAALIVPDPSGTLCREASHHGVAIIADLRGLKTAAPARLQALAWHPSVLLALIDDVDWSNADLLPIVPVGCVVDRLSDAATWTERSWVRVIGVELDGSHRPPIWLASCGRPVIAIRRGVTYADFHDARAACDRLQADLAPQFDLAGYFVAP
jgi:hypothetical protein